MLKSRTAHTTDCLSSWHFAPNNKQNFGGYPQNTERDVRVGQFWMLMAHVLIGDGSNHNTNNHWTVQYHHNNCQLSGSISVKPCWGAFAREVDSESQRAVGFDSNAPVKLPWSIVSRTYRTREESKTCLSCPHFFQGLSPFLIKSTQDRNDRWWFVGADADAKYLENILVWMNQNLPRTMTSSVKELHNITMDHPLVSRAWHFLNQYLESNKHAHLQSPTSKIYARVMMIFVLTTYFLTFY